MAPNHITRSPLHSFYLGEDTLLRTETSPSQIHTMEAKEPPHLHGLARPLLPARHRRRDALPDLPPGRGPRRRPRDHARRPEGDAAAAAARALRRRAERARFTTDFFPFTEPSLEVDVSCFRCDGAGCSLCKHSGWIEIGGSGMVDPNVLRFVGYDPEEVSGLRVRLGPRAHGDPPPRAARHPRPVGERPPLPGAVLKVPLSWLREYASPDVPVEAIAARLSVSTCEVERIVRRGVPGRPRPVPRRQGALGREAPERRPAAALRRRRRRQASSRSSAARGTSAPARPSPSPSRARRCRTGSRSSGASCAAQMSEGMILAEDEVDLGTDHAGIMLLADDLEPGTPLADVLPLVDDVLEIETTPQPARPALDLRPRARGGGALRRAARALARRRSAPRAATSRSPVDVEDWEGCPRYLARLFRDVAIGPSPVWLKARVLAAGMRPISNVVDVTNYVMLALGSPLHAFDHDTLAGGMVGVRRARDGEEIRTLDGTLRRLDHRDMVIKDGERAIALAAIMGGEETEVTAADDEHPPRGGELRADLDPAHVRAARAADRGVEPVGEGRRSVPRRACGPARDAADRRDVRRPLGGRDRRARRPPGAAARRAAAGAHERAARPRRPRRRAARHPAPAPVRRRRRHGDGADVARAGRDARGRPHRGGRALRARRRAVHAAGPPGGDRPPHPRAAAAARRSRTCSSAAASRRRTRRASSARIPTATRCGCPTRSRATSRSCARRCSRACSPPPSGTDRWATSASRSSRSRTSTCRPASSCRTSTCASPASSRAATPTRRASSTRCSRR